MKLKVFYKAYSGVRCVALFIAAVFLSSYQAMTQGIFSVQSRSSTPDFQLFVEIDGATGAPLTQPPSPLFSPPGGVYAMTFLNGTVYGVELENSTGDEYLVTIPHEGFFIGQGARVGETPIGDANIEGMAAVDGGLIVSALRFAQHMTTFVTVDPTTGVGTPMGNSGFDEMIVGLAYDPVSRTLYGAGIPFGDGELGIPDPNLFTIDPQTGATTLIGNMGTIIQGLAWHSELGLIGSFDRFYSINTTTGEAISMGDYDYTDGLGTGPGLFNGLYGLAAVPPEVVTPLAPFNITEIVYSRNGTVNVIITWESIPEGLYQLWHNPAAAANALGWTPVGEVIEATGDTISQTHTLAVGASEGYYRVTGERQAQSP